MKKTKPVLPAKISAKAYKPMDKLQSGYGKPQQKNVKPPRQPSRKR